ncbi:MAG: alpha/beta hydrolase [Coriobacteriia bacterium]|nr:alpha/beta hydrolase [Coriobacteriia bacterium]MBN2822869.1 alpha/beta hydrolase [Coriobacteriia bacterium]
MSRIETAHHWWTTPLRVIAAVVILAVLGFIVWAETPLGPAPEALEALRSYGGIVVTDTDSGLHFAPEGDRSGAGIVFYPGGRVDYRSYAPLARALAEDGHVVVIVRMPLNLAVFGINRASEAMSSDDDVDRWFLAGHSLGGAMACVFAADNPQAIAGLCLLASYPPDSSDLSDSGIPVISIRGTEDGGDLEKWQSAARLLPADTVFLELQGGNHAQFGAYGEQPGDGVAAMSAVQQLEATVAFVETLVR